MSNSTLTASAASRAWFAVSAITTATASPTYRTRSIANTGIVAWNIGLPSRPLKDATGGMSPMPSAARSRPVIAAMTPGILVAGTVSTLRMTAWATVVRTNAAYTWSATSRSSVNCPRPARRGTSSLRSVRCPLPNRRPAPSSFCISFTCAPMTSPAMSDTCWPNICNLAHRLCNQRVRRFGI